MDNSTIAIIVSVVAVGATVGIGLASLIVPSLRNVADLREHMADLRERMARLEGVFNGFDRGRNPGTEATP